MRSKLLRVIVAGAAFGAGVFVGTVHRYAPPVPAIPAEVAAPAPESSPATPTKEEPYPDELQLNPFEIASFIDQHPRANLKRLWQRLQVTNETPDASFSFGHACGLCKAKTFEYNLDNDPAREVVLQIKQEYGLTYRYLVFKYSFNGDSKFLGHIGVWAKYPPSDPIVFVSKGKAWLIVQGTSATGSGLGAWVDTVYEVSNDGVRPIASYLAQVNESGHEGFPSKKFVGRPLSCEIKDGHAILNLAYRVEYSAFSGRNIPLFTKQKTAVLVTSLKDDSARIDTARSQITPREFETIYNFDSMGPLEFWEYNRNELRTIANGNDAEKKQWLKEFLKTNGMSYLVPGL